MNDCTLRRRLKNFYSTIVTFGFDPRRTIYSLRGLPTYVRDFWVFKRQMNDGREFQFETFYPCLGEQFNKSGAAKGHYFHQDLLVARRVFASQPDVHVDVGSRIDGFVAHVACFRPIKVIDIRPPPSDVPNVTFLQADIMGVLPRELIECCDSLSCLHACEHFGLGRYGDPVRFEGHLAGLSNLWRMLQDHGTLYFSVPIGPQRIEFNAHRVFCLHYLLRLLEGRFTVNRFSFVDDQGDLHEDMELNTEAIAQNYGCSFGCGIFELSKL